MDRVDKSARKIRKFLLKNPKKPSTQDIHDLRTSISSLEAAFETVGLQKKKGVKRLLREMGDVRKRAGKVRDMDVLIEAVLTVKEDEERDCLVQLTEYLGSERIQFARKLRRHIERKNADLGRDLERNCKGLEKVLHDSHDKPEAATVQLSAELYKPARLTRANLHSYRLKVKELRNVLQLSDRKGNEVLLKQLGAIKDAIGEWHDWDKLIVIAKEQIQHEGPCRLLKQFKSASEVKFKRALSLIDEFRTASRQATTSA